MHHSEARQAGARRALALPLTATLAWSALGLALAVAYLGLAAGRISLDVLYHSDALYLPALYRDLAGGLDLRGWSLTPAPYFFPDMPLFFGLNWLLGSFRLTIVAYGLAQVLLFVAGLSALCRLMAGRSPHIQSLAPLAGALFFLYFYAAPFPVFSLVLASAHHFGVMVVGVGCLGLVGATLARPRVDRALIACVLTALLLSALTVASDMLYTIHVLAPLLLSLWLLALLRRITYRRALCYSALGLALPAGAALGRTLSRAETRFSLPPFSLQSLRAGLGQLADWVPSFWLPHPLLAIAAAGFLLAAGWVLARLLRERAPSAQSSARLLVVSFLAFQILTGVLGVLYIGSVNQRYLLPLILMPTFFGWPLLAAAAHRTAGRLDNRWGARIAAGAAALGCLAILAQTGSPQQIGQLADYYPELVRCVDAQARQRQLQSGLSNYWQAKYISMLSHNGLQVVQIDPQLRPWYWINNRRWYRQRFDFVIIDPAQAAEFRLDRAKIVGRFGPPDDSFACAGSEILVYRGAQFREQFLAPGHG